jgi:hypothetical protein
MAIGLNVDSQLLISIQNLLLPWREEVGEREFVGNHFAKMRWVSLTLNPTYECIV